MWRIPDTDRDLDYASLLAEIHALVGQRVVVELVCGARPVALEVRGRLGHLADFQLLFGSSLDEPARLAFTLEGSEAMVTLREDEILSARSYTVPGAGALKPSVVGHPDDIEVVGHWDVVLLGRPAARLTRRDPSV
jgi:hypothetical protein